MTQSRKIKILHLVGSTGLYGAERWILALLRALDPERFVSIVLNLVDEAGEVSDVVAAARQRGATAMDFHTGGKFNPAAAFRLAEWVRKEEIAIIHGHGYKSDIVGLLTGRLAGCRVMTTPHGWSVEKDLKLQLYEKLDRFLFRYMDLVCPLSPKLAKELACICPASRLRLVNNGVDLDEVRAGLRRERSDTKSFVIGYIGRLVKLKNLETLLLAFHALAQERPSARLVIIGDGPERGGLEGYAEALGIAAAVGFLGFRDDAVSFLVDFDVFVLPSQSEGTPRCVMEAMSVSVPIVASDIPGNRNLVTHGETGLLFSTVDSNALTGALCHIMDNPDQARAMAAKGRRKVEEEFSSRKMASEYANLYLELMGQPS